MASLDFTNGSIIDAGKFNSDHYPEKENLVPVSKISKYDTPLVCANEVFIAYPTSKPGVVRIISQDDASHVTFQTGGKHVRGLTMSIVKSDNGDDFTRVAALVENENGTTAIWTWQLPTDTSASDLTDQQTSGSKIGNATSNPNDRIKSIKLVDGTSKLLIVADGSTTPFINEYDTATGTILAHQPVFSNIVDVSVFRGQKLILCHDGALFRWNYDGPGPYLRRFDLPELPNPQGMTADGGIIAYDNQIALLQYDDDDSIAGGDSGEVSGGAVGGEVSIRNVIDLGSTLKKPYEFKLLQFENRYVIVADISGSKLIFIRLSSGGKAFRTLAVLNLPSDYNMLNLDVTQNLDNHSGVAFDVYLFHSKGLAILQVTKNDLAADGATVLSAKKPAQRNNKAKRDQIQQSPQTASNQSPQKQSKRQASQSSKKQQSSNGTSNTDSTDDKLVSMVAERLIKSGKFVSSSQFNKMKDNYEARIAKLEKELSSFGDFNSSSAPKSSVTGGPNSNNSNGTKAATPNTGTVTPEAIWNRASIWAPIGSPSSSVQEESPSLDASWGSVKHPLKQQQEQQVSQQSVADVANSSSDSVDSMPKMASIPLSERKSTASIWGSVGPISGQTSQAEENQSALSSPPVVPIPPQPQAVPVTAQESPVVPQEVQSRPSPSPQTQPPSSDPVNNPRTETASSTPSIQSPFEKDLMALISNPTRDAILLAFPPLDRTYDPAVVETSQQAMLSTIVVLALVFRNGQPVRQPTHAKILNWINEFAKRLDVSADSGTTVTTLKRVRDELSSVPGSEFVLARLRSIVG